MDELQPQKIFATRYRLIEKIGAGGFSEVWKAVDEMALETEVALKIYAPDKGLDKNGIKQFRREYALTQPLENAHLLKASHFDVEADSPYLVMPLCERGSLQNLLFDLGQLDDIQLARIMDQIGGGLAYLHSHDILHQDIKPDNILINRQGDYLLTDFGISVKMRGTLQKATSLSRAVTLAYSPPEKYSSRPRSLPGGDIFSMGVMLYELATGDIPWSGHGGMVLLKGAVVPDLPESHSDALNKALKACMHPQPSQRPSARQLARFGREFLVTGVWEDIDQVPDLPLETPEEQRPTFTDTGPRVPSGRVTQALDINELDFSADPPTTEEESIGNIKEEVSPKEVEVVEEVRLPQEDSPEKESQPPQEEEVSDTNPTQEEEKEEVEEKESDAIVPPPKPKFLKRVLQFGLPALLLAGLGTGWWLWPGVSLIPVQEADGEWGYVNPEGELQIDYQFQEAGQMVKERAVVREGEGYGVINAKGEWMVPSTLEEAYPYSSGRARARQDGRYGFLNRSGQWAIPPQYHHAGDFVDGLARVEWQGAFGFLDTGGDWEIPATWEYAEDFSEGMALVSQKGLYGYINSAGKLNIPCEYELASSFHDGLAAVMMSGAYGYLKSSGEIAISAIYQEASSFQEGRAVVRKDSLYVYIDTDGRVLGEMAFEIAEGFVDQRARVYQSGNWAFIDPQIQLMSDWYEHIDLYEGQWARVVNDGQVAYLDSTGQRLTGWYDEVYPFFDGRARIRQGKKFGFIDSSGQEVIPPVYTDASDFGNGTSWVQKDGRYTYIDRDGNFMEEFDYEEVKYSQTHALIPVSKAEKWVYLNVETGTPLTGSWDQAEPFFCGRARVHTGQGWTYIREDGQPINDDIFEEAEDFLPGLRIATGRKEGGRFLITHSGDTHGPFDAIRLLGRNDVIAVGKDGLLALSDTRGNLLSEFMFEEIQAFDGGNALVGTTDGSQFLKASGTLLSTYWYDEIGPMKDGLAWVKKDRFYGLIDEQGKEIFAPKMERVEVYPNGYAVVRENSKFSIVDRSGEMLHENLDRVAFISEQGLAGVAKLGKYGLLSVQHGMITDFLFQRIYRIQEGVAETRQMGERGFLDKRGEWAVEPAFEFVGKFFRGVAVISGENGYGLIDRSGNILMEPSYTDIGAFDRGRPFSWVENQGTFALVDLRGNIRTDWYDEIEHIGLLGFIVQQEQGRALINEAGENISQQYDEIGSYFDGRMLVRKQALYGFIDRSGKEVIPCQFGYASPFANGRAMVIDNGQSFYIDRDGKKLDDEVKAIDNQLIDEGAMSE